MLNILSRDGLISFLYTLPALLLSLSVHEYFHAFVAYKLGDESQKDRGRLTLNPFAHIDVFGFICIALFGFGWGAPVIVNDTKFKKRTLDNMLVALAGPLSNFVLAIIFTGILKVIYMTNFFGFYAANVEVFNTIIKMLYYVISFNIVFSIFNLIPLPPLDGSKVLFYFLPTRAKGIMYFLEKYSFIIILVLFLTNIPSIIISPLYNVLMSFVEHIIIL